MKNLVKKNILQIKPYSPGKPIEEVKRELGLEDVIKLASNENPYGPSPKVLKAMIDAAKTVNRYPDGSCFYLRQEIAKRLKVAPEQVIFGNGSDEIILLLIKALAAEDDEVVMVRPAFLMYQISTLMAGAVPREIPLKDFSYDWDAMKSAVNEKTKAIIIGNPDNPSGAYASQNQLEDFLKGLRPDIIVLLDEAYFEYVDVKDYPDSLSLMKKYPNLVVTRTFSKVWGLAGLRIGYGMGNSELIELLNRIREPFNINSIAQAAALACLKDEGYYRNIIKKTLAQKKIIIKALKSLGVSYVSSCTNFILIKVKQNSTDVFQTLLKKGVIVRDMKAWGLDQYIRATIGTDKENKRLIKALKEVL